MTTFTNLTDSQLDLGKPVSFTIARALRDNPLAVGEGDPTAPRILTKAINSQYFLAQQTTDYTVDTSGGSQKMHFATEVYDPDSLYDNATNYRFLPTVAGVYLVSAGAYINTSSSSVVGPYTIEIRKNGSAVVSVTCGQSAATNGVKSGASICAPIQMNGSTDYLEIYISTSNTIGIGHGHRGYFTAIGLCEA